MWVSSWTRRRVLCLVVGVALTTAVSARPLAPSSNEASAAERAPPAVLDALRDVWARNPSVQSAEARLDAARANADAAARPLYNPDLEIAAENADVDTRSVGFSQTIDWSGKRRARENAAGADVRAVEAERDDARQRIALEWLRGYAGFHAAMERTELGAQRVRLLERFADLAARRFRAGDVSVLERDLAELAVQEARAQQAELNADQAKARQLLAGVGGRIDVLPPLPSATPSLAAFAQVAPLDRLPALRRAQAESDAAQAKIALAERDTRPDPTISLTGGRVTSGPFNDRLIGIAVKIPLFVRNSYRAEVTAARSNADAAEATQRDVALRAAADVEQAASSYDALREAWVAWDRSRAPAADERAALLQRLWEAGEISAADYLVQLKQGIETELAASALRARVWQAFADWLAASGELSAWLGTDAPMAIESEGLPR